MKRNNGMECGMECGMEWNAEWNGMRNDLGVCVRS